MRVVEERIGQPLFHRTTRSVALTEVGRSFLDEVEPCLNGLEQGFDKARAARSEVSGLLRISASRIAAHMCLTPILRALSERYPQLTVEVQTNEAFVDIVAGGFDAGVRLGDAVQQDMVAVRLTPPFKAILVASPDYIARHGAPRSIEDLRQRKCIGFRQLSSNSIYAWDLRDEAGRDVQLDVGAAVIVTDALYCLDLALAGVGIAYLFEPLAREDLAQGKLAQVLPQSAIEEYGWFLYFPRRASQAPKLRAFIDAARAQLTKS